jgi:hypothetical protein
MRGDGTAGDAPDSRRHPGEFAGELGILKA